MEKGKLDASTGYTCISCRLVFANGTLQRNHYQSEWHRYNVKRQVASLPPISYEVFENKVQQFQDPSKEKTEVSKQEDNDYCAACGKKFKSHNAFENHVQSKKHKENMKKFEENGGFRRKQVTQSQAGLTLEQVKANEKEKKEESDDDDTGSWKTVDSGEEDFEYDEDKAIPSTSCLFCTMKSDSVEANLEHMTSHGFFIPDVEYCKDAEGLLNYLGMKVGCGGLCTLCNRRSRYFRSVDAVRKHMRDKQHCRFSIEGEEIVEYLDFYDYGALLVDESEEYDNVAVDEGFTLILPSGAKLGHRQLMRYYKQRLRLNPMKMTAAQNRKALDVALGRYRALGWTGEKGQLALQKARDTQFMKKVTSKYWMQSGIKANKLFKSRGRDDQV